MDAPESPGTQKVVGVLSRGEDTDGETSDFDVDYPSESFVSQLDDEGAEDDAPEAELEVTGEGTAGGPFGLKKVLFVRKKSVDKGMAPPKDEPKDSNKPQETFKDRVSKLGSGVTERFAALGSMMQDHGKAAQAATKPEKPADDEAHKAEPATTPTGSHPTVSTPGSAESRSGKSKQGLEYFQEYDMTFTSKPAFFVVPGPQGKGAMVAWPDPGAPVTSSTESSRAPPSGAVILSVGAESVVDAEPAHVMSLLASGGGGDVTGTAESSPAVTDGEESEAAPDEAGAKAKEGAGFPMVIRFRERGAARQEGWQGGAAGGEFFRSRVKAMATGFNSLFQVKDPPAGNQRDGSDASAAAASSSAAPGAPGAVPADMFVLTFALEGGSSQALPFTLAEMVGGRGVMVESVRNGCDNSLVKPIESGVSSSIIPAVADLGGGEVKSPGSEMLQPGAILLRVAGQVAEGKSLAQVQAMLDAAAAEHSAIKILFRCAPPIYRASVAAELAIEALKTPHVHIGTWQPTLKRRAGVSLGVGEGEGGGVGGSVIGIGYGGEEWEDVRETMARAQQFLNGFRSCGIRIDVMNMQTVMLPRNVKSAYAGMFEGRPGAFQQAVRVWFSFPDERTFKVKKDSTGLLGLTPVETKPGGILGSWLTVTAAEGSPCAEAGIPVGDKSILTHVNGFDVSPTAYRSLAPLPSGGGEGWAAAVAPLLEGAGRDDAITLTIV